MVNHEEFSAKVQSYALEQVQRAANSSSKASPEQFAQVLADVAIFAAEEFARQQSN